jgi:hypothetical protein
MRELYLGFDGVVEQEYLDDGGSNMGVTVNEGIARTLWVTLRSSIEGASTPQEHGVVNELIGKRVRVEIYLTEADNPEDLGAAYAARMFAPLHLSEADQERVRNMINGTG